MYYLRPIARARVWIFVGLFFFVHWFVSAFSSSCLLYIRWCFFLRLKRENVKYFIVCYKRKNGNDFFLNVVRSDILSRKVIITVKLVIWRWYKTQTVQRVCLIHNVVLMLNVDAKPPQMCLYMQPIYFCFSLEARDHHHKKGRKDVKSSQFNLSSIKKIISTIIKAIFFFQMYDVHSNPVKKLQHRMRCSQQNTSKI